MARHPHTTGKAKQELAELAALFQPQAKDLVGGGYFVTLTATEPYYRTVTFFVWADNRKHALAKVDQYDEASEFITSMVDAIVTVQGAGPQAAFRAEGIVREVNEKTEPRGRNDP